MTHWLKDLLILHISDSYIKNLPLRIERLLGTQNKSNPVRLMEPIRIHNNLI